MVQQHPLQPLVVRLLALACVALSSSRLAHAAIWPDTGTDPCIDVMPSDQQILNFALNLEYLEANFYSCAAYGMPINASLWGAGPAPLGCKKASLSPTAQLYAEAIAQDELNHVILLRSALGSAAVDMPLLDIGQAFAAAANAAFGETLPVPFDAYANDVLFYHAAFIFEDVGVTAYKRASPMIICTDYISAVAGIIAVEAYHGGSIRTLLIEIAKQYVFPYGVTVETIVGAISALRAAVSGAPDDKGLYTPSGGLIIAPADDNAVAYSRTTDMVLNVVYLGGEGHGGFFPNGLNGAISMQGIFSGW